MLLSLHPIYIYTHASIHFIYCPHLSYQTFIGRFRRTMDSSQNAYNEDTSARVERLDCLERSLFKAGQSGLNSFQLWEKGRSSHLTASSLVINYRKRKITDLQAWKTKRLQRRTKNTFLWVWEKVGHMHVCLCYWEACVNCLWTFYCNIFVYKQFLIGIWSINQFILLFSLCFFIETL